VSEGRWREVKVVDMGPFYFEVIGLGEPETPDLLIRTRCKHCGLIIAKADFDVREPDRSAEVISRADQKLVLAHLRAFHGIDLDPAV